MLHVETGTSLKTFVPAITTRRWLINSRRLLPMLLGLCACLGLAKPAGAVVRYVDSGAPPGGDGLSWGTANDSLSIALTAAQSGDQIWVAAGTYVGNFTLALGVGVYGGFVGNETELSQRDWTANPTILDGNGTGSVVTSPSGATATTRIDGFTITNGSGTVSGSYTYGGGMHIEFSSPTIANNTITDNRAYHGGGLYLYKSSSTIANNTFTGNSADRGGGLCLRHYSSPTIENNTVTGNIASSSGGGLYLYGDSSPTIANNTITGNRASDDGGGLYLLSSSPTIETNTIAGNRADGGGGLYLRDSRPTIANNTITGNDAAYGAGLYLLYSSPTIENNTITGNHAVSQGGAMYVESSGPRITNNTITANRAFWGGGLSLLHSAGTITNNTITSNGAVYGGGLSLEASSSPTIANSTIAGNGAWRGGGLYLSSSSPRMANTIIVFNSSGIYRFGSGGTPTLRYNCVYGNGAYDYSGLTNPTGTDGNISADPRLADQRYGNVHIQPDSPCVDAGSNYDASDDFDMDGEPRIQGGTVDIGADESDGTVWPAGPYVVVRVSPAGDDANDGSSWALAKVTVQAGIDAASALGGEVWVQGDTYEERITLHPYAYVYGGFAGGETMREQRNWRANVTTLDGQQQGSVVTARVGYQVSAIDGFTITNGNASYSGGGLYLASSPTIANNTITGNRADFYGGGLQLYASSPTIANNTITGNGAVYGGGLALYHSSATIANSTIAGNGARLGGGLYLTESSSPTIVNSTITGNSAGDSGGGLHLYNSSPTMANNTISGNSSSERGGGLSLWGGSFPTIANTIVAFNSSGLYRFYGTPILRYNCVYGNTAYDYSGLSDPTGTDGNISADPLFAQNPNPGPDSLWGTSDDDPGDPQLSSGSPCIDAGDNDGVPPDTPDLDDDSDTTEPLPLDLAGGPRFLDDPQSPDTGNPGLTGFSIVDMGAYEFVSSCGNGVVDPGEECDHAGESATCDVDCTVAECGDGTLNVTAGEECDDAGESTTCDVDCTVAECGDGRLNVTADEECDDGNTSNNDDCLSDCTLPTCGDGYVWNEGSGTEECDDGLDNSDTEPDACRTDCVVAYCCDGVVDTGEECDDGPDNSDTEPDACRTTCMLPSCGDGVVDTGEECDDGDSNSDTEPDACRINCVLAHCCDGVVDTDEECDTGPDKSDTEPDACRRDCRQAWCGDGVVDTAEECDDGNTQAGDGCDATCHIEPEVIPTVSQWGLTVMALLLLSGLKIKFGQRRSAHASRLESRRGAPQHRWLGCQSGRAAGKTCNL